MVDDMRVWVVLGIGLAFVVWFIKLMDARWHAQLQRAQHHDEQATARMVAPFLPAPVPQTVTYSPHSQYQYQGGPLAAPAGAIAPAELPAAALPGVTTLGQVLDTGFWPSLQAILLAQGPGGTLLTVPIRGLLHLLLIGPTNVGKSTIERLIIPQLQVLGCETEWWNPHYTPLDRETGEEWAAIAAHTRLGRALVDEAEILAALEQLVTVELPARKARYRQGQVPGPARFYIIDEAPILAGYDKRFMEWLGVILREGRKFGLFVIMATQDALVSTLGGHSGLRAQAQTIYYGGGDRYSAKALLGFVPDDPPGQGIVRLKSAVTADVPLVRVPWTQNADLTRLYARAPAPSAPSGPPPAPSAPVVGEVVDARPEGAREGEPPWVPEGARAAILAGLRTGKRTNLIIKDVFGVSGGREYIRAAEYISTIMSDLARQVAA